jgi:prohibitin 2
MARFDDDTVDVKTAVKQIKWLVFGVILIAIIIIVLFGSFYTIDAGHRGVLLTFGKADGIVRQEGLGIKFPIVQKIVKMSVQTQKYEADASAASKDLQIVTAKIATNYHLISEQVPVIYTDLGLSYDDRVIQPMEQEVVKSTTAQYTAEELITKREDVRQAIKTLLTERLRERGIIVEEVSITDFDFSKSFNDAIEAKVTAEQQALAAKNKLEQVKYEAEQKVAEAKGKAEAISIESKALQENPDILQLRAIEKWNGVMPQVTGGAMPFVQIK